MIIEEAKHRLKVLCKEYDVSYVLALEWIGELELLSYFKNEDDVLELLSYFKECKDIEF